MCGGPGRFAGPLLRCVWSLAGAAGGVLVRFRSPDYGGSGGGGRGMVGGVAGGGGSGGGGGRGDVTTPWQCEFCHKYYGSNNSLRNHRSVYHRRQVPPSPEGSAKLSVSGGVSRNLVPPHTSQGRPPLLPPAQQHLVLPLPQVLPPPQATTGGSSVQQQQQQQERSTASGSSVTVMGLVKSCQYQFQYQQASPSPPT